MAETSRGAAGDGAASISEGEDCDDTPGAPFSATFVMPGTGSSAGMPTASPFRGPAQGDEREAAAPVIDGSFKSFAKDYGAVTEGRDDPGAKTLRWVSPGRKESHSANLQLVSEDADLLDKEPAGSDVAGADAPDKHMRISFAVTDDLSEVTAAAESRQTEEGARCEFQRGQQESEGGVKAKRAGSSRRMTRLEKELAWTLPLDEGQYYAVASSEGHGKDSKEPLEESRITTRRRSTRRSSLTATKRQDPRNSSARVWARRHDIAVYACRDPSGSFRKGYVAGKNELPAAEGRHGKRCPPPLVPWSTVGRLPS